MEKMFSLNRDQEKLGTNRTVTYSQRNFISPKKSTHHNNPTKRRLTEQGTRTLRGNEDGVAGRNHIKDHTNPQHPNALHAQKEVEEASDGIDGGGESQGEMVHPAA